MKWLNLIKRTIGWTFFHQKAVASPSFRWPLFCVSSLTNLSETDEQTTNAAVAKFRSAKRLASRTRVYLFFFHLKMSDFEEICVNYELFDFLKRRPNAAQDFLKREGKSLIHSVFFAKTSPRQTTPAKK